MLKIYVAGPITAPDHHTFLSNCKRGMQACAEVMKRGFAPFHVFTDFLYILSGEGVTEQHLIDTGLAWLGRSDAVLLTGDWKSSKGSLAEELNIPIFTDLDTMCRVISQPAFEEFNNTDHRYP